MNKISIGRKIDICNVDGISVKGNRINILKDGEYLVEYIDDNNYNITFMIDGNVKIIEYCLDKRIRVNNKYIVNSGSLIVNKFYNNYDVYENIYIDLMNEMCKIDYHFANICKGNEEYVINVNHHNKNTISNIRNSSIALKNSSIKFIINSNVREDCIKSVLDQNTRIITLGECDTQISPNMFIDIDDVIAKHGSIVGTVNDNQLFYLMSKGISYHEALKLLIRGCIFSNLEVNAELIRIITDIIDVYWR